MSTGSLKSRIQHYFLTKLIRELSINVKVSPVQSVYWLANHSKREVKRCMILKLDFEDAVSFDSKCS